MNRWKIGGICLLALGCGDDLGAGSSEAGTVLQASSMGGQGGAPATCTLIGTAAGFGPGSLIMEGENLPLLGITRGDTLETLQSATYSNGQSLRVYAYAQGDQVTFGPVSCPANLSGGSWDVQLRGMHSPWAPKVHIKYAPATYGPWYDLPGDIDLYSKNIGLQTIDLGRTTFQDTPRYIYFGIVGKNAASEGYTFNIDYLEFAP